MLKRLLHHENQSVELLLILLSVGPVMMSAYMSFVTGDGHWFQRSGSLMVLFSVAVEYRRAVQRARAIDSTGNRLKAVVEAQSKPVWRSVPYICYLQILMGTLIWGYGDLMF